MVAQSFEAIPPLRSPIRQILGFITYQPLPVCVLAEPRNVGNRCCASPTPAKASILGLWEWRGAKSWEYLVAGEYQDQGPPDSAVGCFFLLFFFLPPAWKVPVPGDQFKWLELTRTPEASCPSLVNNHPPFLIFAGG